VTTDPGTPDETTLVFVDPRLRAVGPSLKLGVNYWF